MTPLSDRLTDAKNALDRSIDGIVKAAQEQGHSIDRATVARYVQGKTAKQPPERTLQALAAGLGLDVRELRVLAGQPRGELGPYQPPSEAARLSQDQRTALDQLIKAIVAEDGSSSARPTTTGGDQVAAQRRQRGRPAAEYDDLAARQDPPEV